MAIIVHLAALLYATLKTYWPRQDFSNNSQILFLLKLKSFLFSNLSFVFSFSLRIYYENICIM